jgi:hypothetical protein
MHGCVTNREGSWRVLRGNVCKLLVTALVCFSSAYAQQIPDLVRQKASPKVLERAVQNLPQQVNVILDDEDLARGREEKRRARGLRFNDKRISDETRSDLAKLKEGVFPGRKLEEIQVVHDHPDVPIVVVNVPNARALARLARHPRVKFLNENDSVYYKQMQESLPARRPAKAARTAR